MHSPASEQIAAQLEWRESAGSTNLELIELAQNRNASGQPNLPNFTVYVTANQQAGRGRSGRVWEAPKDSALAISVLLYPPVTKPEDLGKLGWLPLLAGLAMSQTVESLLASSSSRHLEVGVKWPNDVLVAENKICGVLAELLTVNSKTAVVIGAGINLSQTRQQLPIETATSLELLGASLPEKLDERFDLVLAGYLTNLKELYGRFVNLGLDAVASGVRQQVINNCVTLGREVRAELPDGTSKLARAVTIDDSGRLVLDALGQVMALSAADIVHLRH